MFICLFVWVIIPSKCFYGTVYFYSSLIVSSLLIYVSPPGVHSADEVIQTPDTEVITEGESLLIQCDYKTSSFYAMHWYKQSHLQTLQHIGRMRSSGKDGGASDKFQFSLDTSRKTGSLTIKPTVADSAVYYCAYFLPEVKLL
ncbi:HVM06 protein, partial [Atractosteus spatula]|nr:HVM06 protein [Atractosteus spatula]